MRLRPRRHRARRPAGGAGGNGVYLAGGVESISTAPLRAHRNDDGEPGLLLAGPVCAAQLRRPGHGRGCGERRRPLSDQPGAAGCVRAAQPPAGPRGGRGRDASTAKSFRCETAGRNRRAPTTAAPGLSRGRPDARFPPAFVPGGTVTAGNSCFDADAASAVVITSLQRARELGAADGLLVLGTDTAGVDPGCSASARPRRGAAAGRHGHWRPRTWTWWNSMRPSPPRPSPAWTSWASTRRANLDGGALALGHAYGASGLFW